MVVGLGFEGLVYCRVFVGSLAAPTSGLTAASALKCLHPLEYHLRAKPANRLKRFWFELVTQGTQTEASKCPSKTEFPHKMKGRRNGCEIVCTNITNEVLTLQIRPGNKSLFFRVAPSLHVYLWPCKLSLSGRAHSGRGGRQIRLGCPIQDYQEPLSQQ